MSQLVAAKTTKVVSVKQRVLQKNNYRSLDEWILDPNNVYIGRTMERYARTKNVKGSKWGNPFIIRKGKTTRISSLEQYKEYIKKCKLYDQLDELIGKNLGCWCYPLICHGNVLIELINEKKKEEADALEAAALEAVALEDAALEKDVALEKDAALEKKDFDDDEEKYAGDSYDTIIL